MNTNQSAPAGSANYVWSGSANYVRGGAVVPPSTVGRGKQQLGKSVFLYRRVSGFPEFGVIPGNNIPVHSFPSDNPITFQWGRLFKNYSEQGSVTYGGQAPRQYTYAAVCDVGTVQVTSGISAAQIPPLITGPILLGIPNYPYPVIFGSAWYSDTLASLGFIIRYPSSSPDYLDSATVGDHSVVGFSTVYIGTGGPDVLTTGSASGTLMNEMDYATFAKTMYSDAAWSPSTKTFSTAALNYAYQNAVTQVNAQGSNDASGHTLQCAFLEDAVIVADLATRTPLPEILPGHPNDGSIQVSSGYVYPGPGNGLVPFNFVPSFFMIRPGGIEVVLCVSEIQWSGPFNLMEATIMNDWEIRNPVVISSGSVVGKVMIPPPGVDIRWQNPVPANPWSLDQSLYISPANNYQYGGGLFPVGKVRYFA